MNVKVCAFGVFLLASVAPARGHLLDEYLQATFISVEKEQFRVDLFLTPGLAVLPAVLAGIDTDGNGVISAPEQRRYAERVLNDLSFTLNGTHLVPQLTSFDFPSTEQLRDGRGDIHLEFTVKIAGAISSRSLCFENRHQERIAAYQVNCLVTRDSRIRIGAQRRNTLQSSYELEMVVMPE